MGSRGPRRRKPRRRLPPAPKYMKPAWGTRYWRLGGRYTDRREAEARAARAAHPPGRFARFVLRVLGYRPPGPPRAGG